MKGKYNDEGIKQSRKSSKCPLCGGVVFSTRVTRCHEETTAEWKCGGCGAEFSASFEFIKGSVVAKEKEAYIEYENRSIAPCGEVQRRW